MKSLFASFKNPSFLSNLLFCSLTGVLVSFSYNHQRHFWIAWVAFVPLLYVVKNQRPLAAYGYGAFTGSLSFFLTLDWLVFLIENFMEIPSPYSYLLMGAFTVVYGLNFGVIFMLTEWLAGLFPRCRPVLFPTLFMAIIYLIPSVFFFNPGETQLRFVPALQMTEYFGAKGLGWLMLLVNVHLSDWLKRDAERPPVRFLPVVVVLLAGWFGLGEMRFRYWSGLVNEWETKTVGMVQPNRSIETKQKQTFEEKTANFEFGASLALSKKDPFLIVWPEGLEYRYFFYPEIRLRFADYFERSRTPLLTQETIRGENSGEYYNSAILFDGKGKVTGTYDKIKLIPFGERMPFHEAVKGFMELFGVAVHGFERGKSQKTFALDGVEILARICYESLFAEFTATGMAKNGTGKLMVFITESEWYDSKNEVVQHLGITALRAVENRSSLVHVINGGYTNVILPTGEIEFMAPYRQRGSYLREVPYSKTAPQTFYTLHPWLVPALLYGMTAFWIGWGLWLRRRPIHRKP